MGADSQNSSPSPLQKSPQWVRRRHGGYKFHILVRYVGSNALLHCDRVEHGVSERDMTSSDNPPEREKCEVCVGTSIS